MEIKGGQTVLILMHTLSSVPHEVVAKFAPKFEGSFPILHISGFNFVVDKERNITLNVDQIRPYYDRRDYLELLEVVQGVRLNNQPLPHSSQEELCSHCSSNGA